MPHLSPMSWIIAIAFFWMFLMIFISTLWWSDIPKFSSVNIYSSHGSGLSWKWLQDGWGHKL